MLVQNQPTAKSLQQTEKTLELKQGDIIQAQIKEVGANGEAILKVRGKEITAKFEGEIPSEPRVNVQIMGVKDGVVQVKMIAMPPTESPDILKSLGITETETPELKQAVAKLIEKGLPVSKEMINVLKTFFETAQGTNLQKLDTVKALANKALEVTPAHLTAIHETLTGKPLSQTLAHVISEIEPGFKVKVEEGAPLKSQWRGNTINLSDTEKSYPKNDVPHSKITELKSIIQREPQLESAIEAVKQKMPSHFTTDQTKNVTNALNEASVLLDQGRELKARQVLIQVFDKIEHQTKPSEPIQSTYENPYENSPGLALQTKDIIVTRVSQKLAQMTQDFKDLKREITRNLDNSANLIQTLKSRSVPQARQMLEATIKKIDTTILKSDMMLFTDMKTEKALMQVSSQLAEAKTQLGKGNITEAQKIVIDIKNTLEALNFKPSEVKVKHYVSQQSLANQSPEEQFMNKFQEIAARDVLKQEPTARQAFEIVRALGLNHDSDVARDLVFNQNSEQKNLKETLMKLMQNDVSGKTSQIEQAVSNITGQQLLSKSDAGFNLQSMFMQIPYLLEEKVENLQIYVNSKTEGQKVDWQNCSLYFLIETKKLGEVGIMLNVTDKNLAITLKNDQPGFKEKMTPIASLTKDKLQDIGYNISNLNFTKLNKEERQKVETAAESKKNQLNMKGMDFKI